MMSTASSATRLKWVVILERSEALFGCILLSTSDFLMYSLVSFASWGVSSKGDDTLPLSDNLFGCNLNNEQKHRHETIFNNHKSYLLVWRKTIPFLVCWWVNMPMDYSYWMLNKCDRKPYLLYVVYRLIWRELTVCRPLAFLLETSYLQRREELTHTEN